MLFVKENYEKTQGTHPPQQYTTHKAYTAYTSQAQAKSHIRSQHCTTPAAL
jgi:hypothetical protein